MESAAELLERVTPAKSKPRMRVRTDLRDYGIGAQILKDLNVGKMRLLAVPRKMPSMAGFGLEVTGYLESRDKSRRDRPDWLVKDLSRRFSAADSLANSTRSGVCRLILLEERIWRGTTTFLNLNLTSTAKICASASS